MKIKQTAFATGTILMMILAVACGDKFLIDGLGDDATGARVKFINTCSNCPTVNVKVGGKFVTGAGLAFGGVFPTVGYGAFPAGDVSYEYVNAADGAVVLAGKVSTTDNKYYTVFLNDTIPTPTAFTTEDEIEAVKEDTLARIRFVHGLSGKPKDTLECVRKIDNKIIASGIVYGKATPFNHLQQGNTADTFFIRQSGSTTAYPGLGNSIATWAKGRTYTLYARGVSGKTVATQVPRLDFYTNR